MECKKIFKVLSLYEFASGQKVNKEKKGPLFQ